jgi:hypothetical protein
MSKEKKFEFPANTPEWIKRIDWSDLRAQKRTLLEVIDKLEKGCKDQLEIDDLEGILATIDALQDYAVDELGIPEMSVFDFELEEEREKSTPEENFARESAERIFDELCESDGFHTDDEMPEEFISSIMADRYDSDIIKAKLRAQILNDLKVHPVLFDICETTKELQYDGDMREDYEGLVTAYIKEKFNSGKTKAVYLCPHCGSDNVEMKSWVNPNTDEIKDSDTGDDDYCNDCQQHGELLYQSIPIYKKVVGFQVVDDAEGDIHPDMEGSFCLYNLTQANEMIRNSDDPTDCWKLLTIWSGDVEDATPMFEGDPRD